MSAPVSVPQLRRAAHLVGRSLTDPVSRDELRAKVASRVAVTAETVRAHVRNRRGGRASLPNLPPFPVPEGPIARPDLRVATILDSFSAMAFGYEWGQHPVPRDGWREQFDDAPPDLLFVESACVGNDRA